MMDSDADADETEKRRDEALRRALTTPPKPHKPVPKPQLPSKKQ